jgi:hypothetical protein
VATKEIRYRLRGRKEMKAMVKRLTIGLMIMSFVIGWPMISTASSVDNIRIIDFGVYSTTFAGWQDAPHTEHGRIQIVGQRNLIKQTKMIPISVDTEFGIRYVLNGRDEGGQVDVLVRVYHAEKQTTEEWVVARRIGTPSFDGWKLGDDSQLVPGKMTVQLFHAGTKLAEKSFTVYETKR